MSGRGIPVNLIAPSLKGSLEDLEGKHMWGPSTMPGRVRVPGRDERFPANTGSSFISLMFCWWNWLSLQSDLCWAFPVMHLMKMVTNIEHLPGNLAFQALSISTQGSLFIQDVVKVHLLRTYGLLRTVLGPGLQKWLDKALALVESHFQCLSEAPKQ